MDLREFDKLPGMALSFPFVMVLLGIVCALVRAFLGAIPGNFFENLGMTLGGLGFHLIQWGAILQGVLWIGSSFARKSGTP
jgi:hypothetical protein